MFRTEVWSALFATPTAGRVSFEVDAIDERESEVLVPADLQHVMRLHPEPWATGDRDRFLRLRVQTVTGRRLVAGDGRTMPYAS